MENKPKSPAMLAIKETKALTNMLRGLLALEDEIGDLANLEKARVSRQAAVAQVDDQLKAKEDELKKVEGALAQARALAKDVQIQAQLNADNVAKGATQSRDRILGEAKAKMDAAEKAKADAAAAEALAQKRVQEAEANRARIERAANDEQKRLDALKAEISALRDRMKV